MQFLRRVGVSRAIRLDTVSFTDLLEEPLDSLVGRGRGASDPPGHLHDGQAFHEPQLEQFRLRMRQSAQHVVRELLVSADGLLILGGSGAVLIGCTHRLGHKSAQERPLPCLSASVPRQHSRCDAGNVRFGIVG